MTLLSFRLPHEAVVFLGQDRRSYSGATMLGDFFIHLEHLKTLVIVMPP